VKASGAVLNALEDFCCCCGVAVDVLAPLWLLLVPGPAVVEQSPLLQCLMLLQQ
jgi:hypothetical protein